MFWPALRVTPSATLNGLPGERAQYSGPLVSAVAGAVCTRYGWVPSNPKVSIIDSGRLVQAPRPRPRAIRAAVIKALRMDPDIDAPILPPILALPPPSCRRAGGRNYLRQLTMPAKACQLPNGRVASASQVAVAG